MGAGLREDGAHLASLSLERPLNDLQVGRAALLQHEAVSRLLGPRVQEALGCQGF